jgi:pimeloyl-ACP methyl ester carboxylesterase
MHSHKQNQPHTAGSGERRRAFGSFTASHRGGTGAPMVCLHGFTGTWRAWELVLPALERHHDVLALTLPGHLGGPALADPITTDDILDAIEETLDEAGFGTAHLVGNSLGGYTALRLAARGRAESVVALAPAGGWAKGDESFKDTLDLFATWQRELKAVAAHAHAIVATPEGRRRATQAIVSNYEHIPAELIAHHMIGSANCAGLWPMITNALREGYDLDAERVTCPVRIVWGTEDRLLAWPSAATRYLKNWLPHADWVELHGIGHCPQLDVPRETAQLIIDFTKRSRHAERGYA